MNILLTITKGGIGGAQNAVLLLTKGLQKAGHDVTVGLGDGQYLRDRLDQAGIPHVTFANLKRTANPFKNLFFIFEIKSFLDHNDFDIIHFHSSNALLGALGAKLARKKAKTVFTIHGLSIIDPNYHANPLLKMAFFLYFKLFLSFVDEKIFVSLNNLETAQKAHLANDGTVIYNAVDEDALGFLEPREARRILFEKCLLRDEGRFVIGSIGRLAYQKNYEFLINIFPEILKIKPEAIAIIIGDGPQKDEYEKLIQENNLTGKIFLIGKLPDASAYLKAFDLFVLPSRYEGLSIVLIEALFAEIDILASAVGGNLEMLTSDQVYQLDDAEEFLKKLSQGGNQKTETNRFSSLEYIANHIKLYGGK